MSSRGAKQRSERLPGTLVSKLTASLLPCRLFILLSCFPGSYHTTALLERTSDASHDTISRHRLDHIPKWKPTKVHYPAFSDAAPVASVEDAFVSSLTSNSSAPHAEVEANFELAYKTLFPPPVQRDRRMLFMINAYYFNATESHVINTLQTLTSWCERGDEVHIALYTTSTELSSYVFDQKQRFFCKRLSSSLPIAVLEYDKNITINIAGMHRYLVADKIEEYDWFLYTEDDLALTHSHVRFLKEWTRVLAPKGTLPHLMRYEVASVRPLGLRRDALLLDEYPLPLSLFRMEVADTEMAARDLDLDEESDELAERGDQSKRSAALWVLGDENGREESSYMKNRHQGDVASLSSHRRRRRSTWNSQEDVHKKLPRRDSSFSSTKTSLGRKSLAASDDTKNGTVFMHVPNPYMAMWLLPQDVLLPHVRESRWLNEVNDPNIGGREHFATFWLRPHFAFTVPLSSMRRALIHHVSTKYAGHGLTQVDADRRETSHPFFLHMYFNVDAWDLKRTLSECMEDDGGRGTGGDKNENDAAAASAASASTAIAASTVASSAPVHAGTLLHKYSSTYKRHVQRHPSSVPLQSPRLLTNSMCSPCLNLGGNVTISVVKRERGEPLEYKVDCLRSERKRQ
jgi:hypothetical protein